MVPIRLVRGDKIFLCYAHLASIDGTSVRLLAQSGRGQHERNTSTHQEGPPRKGPRND